MSVVAKWQNALGVTPSDTQDLRHPSQAICVAVAGNVAVDTVGGQKNVVIPLPAGTTELGVTRIYSTLTTATGIAILWN